MEKLGVEKRFEIVGFVAVFVIALVIRLDRLGTVPGIVTADELDNLQTAYHIIEGTGPGIFGFDWKPGPIFSLYPLAWTVQIFGSSVWAFRLFPVILSLLTLVAFYIVARRTIGAVAGISAMAMFATSLMFLHFSRTAWENVNSALFALGACYATQRAMQQREGRDWALWWAAVGVFSALGLYGYFTGRFIWLAVVMIVVFGVLLGDVEFRVAARGLVIAGVLAAVLFLPMAITILTDWELFTRRTDVTSAFGVPEGRDYLGDTDGWVIAGKNVMRNYEGFILMDQSQWRRGLWGRYNPEEWAPLGFIAKHLFWLGLLVGLRRFRKTYSWWPLFIPVLIAEIFSTGTPDLARGIMIAPLYFLFIGLLFDEVRKVVTSPRAGAALAAGVAALTFVVAATSVSDYFSWQASENAQRLRLPGVAVCEFDIWQELANDAAAAGPGLIDNAAFDRERRELMCSPIVNAMLEPPGG